MDLIMNGLLVAATLFAGIYCWVLSGRVRRLSSLESGLGGAIVTLTRQIELARTTLDEARAASRESRHDLSALVARADAAAAHLRLHLAAVEHAELRAPAAPATPQPVADSAQAVEELSLRRREGPRLVTLPEPEADPDPEPTPAAAPQQEPPPPWQAGGPSLPKPRQPLTLDALMRRRATSGEAKEPEIRSEADLLAALDAIASGGDR